MACHLDDHLAGQPLDHLSDHQAFQDKKSSKFGIPLLKTHSAAGDIPGNIFSAVASHSLLDFCMEVTTSEVNVLEKRMDTTTR